MQKQSRKQGLVNARQVTSELCAKVVTTDSSELEKTVKVCADL